MHEVVHHVCQVILTCEMSEETGVASVAHQVDTAGCGSAVLDFIREKVDSNSRKLDQLLACTSCNGSNSTTSSASSTTPSPLGNGYLMMSICNMHA